MRRVGARMPQTPPDTAKPPPDHAGSGFEHEKGGRSG